MKRGNGSSGFTLIEVVVALAILGVSVAIVMQIFSGGLKNLRRIELAHRAMSHAENVMNEMLADREVIGAGAMSGELDDEFRYTAEVTEWEIPQEHLSLELAVPTSRLLQVTVQIHFVNDRFGKSYRLSTLKTVSTPALPQSLADPGNPLQQPSRGQRLPGIN